MRGVTDVGLAEMARTGEIAEVRLCGFAAAEGAASRPARSEAGPGGILAGPRAGNAAIAAISGAHCGPFISGTPAGISTVFQ